MAEYSILQRPGTAFIDVRPQVLVDRSPLKWRPHIDGLRALSVLAVLLFHAGVKPFSGGFVGVDVFFVISGFLISKIIYDDIAEYGRLRIATFYERRARRILPVFVVVTAATIIVGGNVLLPEAFARLGQSALYATGFAANVFFYVSFGYFGADAHAEPLLHYWSLGVEEQFYITFPLLAFALARYAPRLLAPTVLAVAAFSLALAEYDVRTEPSAAFYLPLPRAWELMVGSLLALPNFPFPRQRLAGGLASTAGLALILFAVFAYRESTPFPGVTALAPVLGAALILWGCDRDTTFVGRVLSARPLRLVGLWSYSIYMMHWPLIVFLKLYWPHPHSLLRLIIVVTAIGLGALSYWFIETPFRGGRGIWGRRGILSGALASLAVLATCGYFVHANAGFPTRFPQKVQEILAYKDILKQFPAWRENQCFLGIARTWENLNEKACLHPGAHPSALLWGDSQAADLYPALSGLFHKHDVALSQANMAACAPMLDYALADSPTCMTFNEKVFAWVRQNRPDKIILSASWPLQPENVEKIFKTVDTLASMGTTVIVIGQRPVYRTPVPDLLAMRALQGKTSREDDGDDGAARSVDLLFAPHFAGRANVIYLSPRHLFCQNAVCPIEGNGGMPLFVDTDHFSEEGAALLVGRLFEAPGIERAIFGSASEAPSDAKVQGERSSF